MSLGIPRGILDGSMQDAHEYELKRKARVEMQQEIINEIKEHRDNINGLIIAAGPLDYAEKASVEAGALVFEGCILAARKVTP